MRKISRRLAVIVNLSAGHVSSINMQCGASIVGNGHVPLIKRVAWDGYGQPCAVQVFAVVSRLGCGDGFEL